MKKTPLYEEHLSVGGKMVDFAGWLMPLHYGSQIEEHHQVRRDAGMFDVSHMGVIDIKGKEAQPFLRHLLANDVAKLTMPGKALYTCMLENQGGVIDDLIVYFNDAENFRLVVNAATNKKDLHWLKQQAENFAVEIIERNDLAMLAVQGPQARAKVESVLSPEQKTMVQALKLFQGVNVNGFWIARTGYTGEEGYEIILGADEIKQLWQNLLKVNVAPIGLGARDTLRLEAGLNLYGQDMDESVTPLESNLAWTVAFEPNDRDFIGRKALEWQKQNKIKNNLVGLIMQSKGVLRPKQQVKVENYGEGEITSGTFSPTLGKSIALARIPNCNARECLVNIRDKWVLCQIVNPPFVRNGKVLV